jgi:protein TonB
MHVLAAGLLLGWGLLHRDHVNEWGDRVAQQGAVQASMVSAIPLPQKVPPVKDNVLTPDQPSVAPVTPPKEATAPPPKPTDVLVKAKTPEWTQPKVAPREALTPPKHPQPTPDTPKAQTGQAATQIAQSVSQVKNGLASATIEDKTFGLRYAYYRDIIARTVANNWFTGEADPRASNGKQVTLVFDVERDGTIENVRTAQRSGSPSLDTSALRALQRIDTGFGPLPGPADHVTVEYTFEYRQP